MKKKMYRILALICVCVMLVCSFSFAADVTPDGGISDESSADVVPTTMNSVYYGSSCGRYSSSGYTETSIIDVISVHIYGEINTDTYELNFIDATASNTGHSIDCIDTYNAYALKGFVYGDHEVGNSDYYSSDILPLP